MQAAAALLNLGSTDGESTILAGLEGKDEKAHNAAIAWLGTLNDNANREFARKHLERIVADASVPAEVHAEAAKLF